MPNLHDIERRISSVQSTKQITRTMEMVSAAKIRRATERLMDATPWTTNLSEVLLNAAKHAPLDAEPLLRKHDEVKRVLVVPVTSDRGLAGGFSSNILKAADRIIAEKQAEGAEVEVIACGKKACGYFKYRGIEPVLSFSGNSADPKFDEAAAISAYSGDAYNVGDLDEVYLLYNHAKNAGEQVVIEHKVLPIDYHDFADMLGLRKKEEDIFAQWRERKEGELPQFEKMDCAFEPDAAEVVHHMMFAYMRNMFFFALVDSAAAEQGARRTAMKAATDNASEMVDTLTTYYNRVRQGAITTEITEIVGGAAALEE
ncbi:MAG: ATP synthase F1 subunit gamma [Coriobacteriia bacterium]|nr:ATP synthase F1 subunit gamma [Coriobacteriia bacterium]